MRIFVIVILACLVSTAHAGGPRFVAGNSYFNPNLAGHPVVWRAGRITYFVDQGDLSPTVDNAVASATVAAAAAVWTTVPTAEISITDGGQLAENVSGANVDLSAAGVFMPADVRPGAIETPVGVIFDADGLVIDTFYGVGASDPDDCIDTGAIPIVDNLTTSGTIAHALILINGRCTGSAEQLEQIQFQLIRAFGRVLGLDWSQANDGILFGAGIPSYQQLEGWPVMRPVDLDCNQLSVQCVPNPLKLRTDDLASISRLYPVTSANLTLLAGKTLTAAGTASIHGTLRFASGQGMQGVNVIARPIIPGVGLADDRYSASSVSGFLFTGNQGNPINGVVSEFGSTDATVEGSYDITGILLPPGETQADYQITLEPVNPLYTGTESVGPYVLGSPTPSGTMPSIIVRGLTAGKSLEQDFTIPDSADDLQSGTGGSPSAPAILPAAGEWQSRIASVGQADWFTIPAQRGRHFTIETQSLDEVSVPTENKLRAVLGVWNVLDPTDDAPVNATIAPFNGAAVGITALAIDTIADGDLLLGIADQRGDGRPDYVLHGRLLYAGTVNPSRLPLAGGQMTITGSGFHPGMTVSIGGKIRATITDLTPTTIVAMAPASAGFTGSLDLIVVDPNTNGIAAIAAGISYGDASSDTLSIVTAPPSTVAEDTSSTFTVRVFGPDQLTPIGGVPVFFSTRAGNVAFNNCAPDCVVMTNGDGLATVQATPLAPGFTKLQAALSNGNALDAEFTALNPPILSALTSSLFLAPEAFWQWTPQVKVITGPSSPAKVKIDWSGQGPPLSFPSSSLTAAQGIASVPIDLGPWIPGTAYTLSACVDATTACVNIPVYTVHPETEILMPVSGLDQQLLAEQPLAPVVMRLVAPGGQPIVGGLITLTGSVRAWTPTCPALQPCEPGRLLAPISLTGISTGDGSVTFILAPTEPMSERLTALATAGSASSIPISIEIHP